MNKAYKEGRNIGNNNGKLSLYPLDFKEATKDLLKVKPESKTKESGK